MNSGKTAKLLTDYLNYRDNDQMVLVVKPGIDTRSGKYVKSRAMEFKVVALRVPLNAVGVVYVVAKRKKPDYIFVDEVQFYTADQVDELVRIVDELGISVSAFGLLTDFRGELFEGSKRLIEVGAELKEIPSVCSYCSDRAVYNMRVLNGVPVFEGSQILIGGNDEYKPVCRKCFQSFKEKSKSNRKIS